MSIATVGLIIIHMADLRDEKSRWMWWLKVVTTSYDPMSGPSPEFFLWKWSGLYICLYFFHRPRNEGAASIVSAICSVLTSIWVQILFKNCFINNSLNIFQFINSYLCNSKKQVSHESVYRGGLELLGVSVSRVITPCGCLDLRPKDALTDSLFILINYYLLVRSFHLLTRVDV